MNRAREEGSVPSSQIFVKKLTEISDDKDSFMLNTAEFLLNMCDNHQNMSRKSKQSKHKKKLTTSLSLVDKYFDLIGHNIFQGNYAEAVTLY